MYTKKQRHDIYKKAISKVGKDSLPYLCIIIQELVNDHQLYSTRFVCKHFPEISLFRPKRKHRNGGGWWVAGDKDTRINCLLFCIEMTKP